MTNHHFVVQKWGRGLCRVIFRADFEIRNLDLPNNPTSHYGACHFGYSLALSLTYFYLYPLNKFSSNFHGSFLILYILHIFDMSVMCVLSV